MDNLGDLFHGGSDTGLLLLIGALAFFVKKQMGRYDKHLDECNEIPKRMIVDQLEDLHSDVRKIAEAQSTQGTQIAQLIGRQIERDNR